MSVECKHVRKGCEAYNYYHF